MSSALGWGWPNAWSAWRTSHQLRGKPIHAAWFLGSAATIRRAIGAPPLPTEELDLQTTATAARAHLDEDAFAAAWVSGEALPQEEAIALALAFLLKPGYAVAELPAQSQHVLDRARVISGWTSRRLRSPCRHAREPIGNSRRS